MKVPKEMIRHCPFCKVHTKHKVSNAKRRAKGSVHPLSKGSKIRTVRRGLWKGHGNLGKYAKPPKPKMVGKKLSKNTDFRYKCEKCNKIHSQKKGIRAKKIEFI